MTHAHREGIAGAIAVVVAACLAWRLRGMDPVPHDGEFLKLVLPHVPDSEVGEGVRRAVDLAPGASVRLAVSALGNGSAISAQDTVPFSLWCAARHLDNFEDALWLTVRGLGDRDTTCAIVGGIVALHTGFDGIPEDWRLSREPFPILISPPCRLPPVPIRCQDCRREGLTTKTPRHEEGRTKNGDSLRRIGLVVIMMGALPT